MIETALREAIRSKDDDRKNVLRMILSSIKLAEVENAKDLDENSLLAIMHKEVKMRQETIEEARKTGRSDIIEQQDKEIIIIKQFLPKPLSDSELKDIIEGIITKTGVRSIKEMGKVMKEAVTEISGRATNSQISQMVRDILLEKDDR